MTKSIEEYTELELREKIFNIKVEREKTADALKKYEEELERRKQEVPFGVPFTPTTADGDCWWLDFGGSPIHNFFNDRNFDHQVISQCGYFKSYESAKKHAEMLKDWRKELVANSKGESIDIQVLLPLMKKGWVAMDKDGDWFWYNKKPNQGSEEWEAESFINVDLRAFNIKQVKNWKNSLEESGL